MKKILYLLLKNNNNINNNNNNIYLMIILYKFIIHLLNDIYYILYRLYVFYSIFFYIFI